MRSLFSWLRGDEVVAGDAVVVEPQKLDLEAAEALFRRVSSLSNPENVAQIVHITAETLGVPIVYQGEGQTLVDELAVRNEEVIEVTNLATDDILAEIERLESLITREKDDMAQLKENSKHQTQALKSRTQEVTSVLDFFKGISKE